MGGSGGGLSPRSGVATQSINCDEVRFDTNLGFLVEGAVERLFPGAVLEVRLERVPNRRVVAQFDAETMGVFGERVPTLIHCLETGATFGATVLSTDNNIVRVRIRPT